MKSRPPIDANLKRIIRLKYPDTARFDVPLSQLSRWKIGGIADVILSPRNTEELAELRAWINKEGLPSVVIGATSNLLFPDEGLQVVVIQIGTSFSSVRIEGNTIIAQPGAWVPGLARKAMLAGLTGIEHICGIPGTLGGLVYMNGGSQRKGIGDHVVWVDSIDEMGHTVRRHQEACSFSYRHSIYQGSGEVISSVMLKLNSIKDKAWVRKEMLAILNERRRKFPQKIPNCGSVFVSNPAMYEKYGPPGKVIELAGCKGIKVGGAAVSDMHANFILNTGNATAKHVLDLIKILGISVERTTGYKMKVEPKYIAPDGQIHEISF